MLDCCMLLFNLLILTSAFLSSAFPSFCKIKSRISIYFITGTRFSAVIISLISEISLGWQSRDIKLWSGTECSAKTIQLS